MQDETGNRRFLIIHTGFTKHLRAFYTRSYGRYKTGMGGSSAYLENEDPELILPENCMQQAKELQEANMADDGKRGIILDYLEGKTQVCAREIWFEALKEPYHQKLAGIRNK